MTDHAPSTGSGPSIPSQGVPAQAPPLRAEPGVVAPVSSLPSTVPPLTLYQDWQIRRERLSKASTRIAEREGLLNILDYLLAHYKDRIEAARLARFPTNNKQLAERRWIVVHHHLGKGEFAGVRNEEESSRRASSILQRMKGLDLQSSVKAPAGGAMVGAPVGSTTPQPMEPPRRVRTPEQQRVFTAIEEALANGTKWRIFQQIEAGLNVSRDLPERAVEYLLARLEGKPLDAAVSFELLKLSGGDTVVDHVFQVWRDSLAYSRNADLLKKLSALFYLQAWQKAVAEKCRAALADDVPKVRIESIQIISVLGSVDDIGLLLDLFTLPPATDDAPGEREALFNAVRVLAGSE